MDPISIQTPPNSQPQASTKAIVSLILGILSMLCCSVFTGIPAIILGRQEEKDIKAGKSPASGEAFAKIGWILGLISSILTVLIILMYAVIAVFFTLGYKTMNHF